MDKKMEITFTFLNKLSFKENLLPCIKVSTIFFFFSKLENCMCWVNFFFTQRSELVIQLLVDIICNLGHPSIAEFVKLSIFETYF
jgi:hypothetical protein